MVGEGQNFLLLLSVVVVGSELAGKGRWLPCGERVDVDGSRENGEMVRM